MVKEMGIKLTKRALPLAIKLATSGMLDLDDTSEQALSNFSEKLAIEQIKKYESSKKTIDNFRKELAQFANEIAKADNNEKLPLIFIIDELDRCRPTYAIELLEKAKHLFNVPNIVFVIGAAKSQLGHSIKSIYGHDMDIDGYLKKFIDLDYFLPISRDRAFSYALFKRFGLFDLIKERSDFECYYQLFANLFSLLNLSLREQEHCFSLLSLSIRTTSSFDPIPSSMLIILIVLKVKKPSLYQEFISRKVDEIKIIDYFKSMPNGDKFMNSEYGINIETNLAFGRVDKSQSRIVYDKYKNMLEDPYMIEEDKNRTKSVLDLASSSNIIYIFGGLDYVVKKIEIASNFSNL